VRLAATFLLSLLFASLALAAGSGRVVSSHGVRFVVPPGWQRVQATSDGPIRDPRTLLVVGTEGVHPRPSSCPIAGYRIPAAGAVVVVVGWKSVASAGGGALKPGRAPLRGLNAVHVPSFECFSGRGAVAEVLLGGKPYQVNVLVGDRASRPRVAEALAVGRSFDLAR
jgi:hypothetical protein